MKRQKIVILGLSITSSWGNGHASTYRGLAKDCGRAATTSLFLERDQEWYASNRDLPRPPYCRVELYSSVRELQKRFGRHIRDASLVGGLVRSEGAAIGCWVTSTAEGSTAFYDIDTSMTRHAWRERS